MLSIKKGVKLHSLSPQMAIATMIINQTCNDHALDCVITSGSDGKHMAHSYHYTGNALDFRHTYPGAKSPVDSTDIRIAITEKLGENFDVVVEQSHIHVEYDPHK